MERKMYRVILVAVATGMMIFVNAAASWFSPSGKNVGQISDQFPNFFTPAGYVFSIWGLIYTALLAFTVYQALPAQRNHSRIGKIDLLYVVSCGFNGVWIVVWQREWFVLSFMMMIGILLSLLAIYLRLDTSRHHVSSQESWFVHWPFSVYLGWITVATVANATILLQYLGWQGGGISPHTWGAIMLGVALSIVLLVTVPRRDKAYLLVFAWASLGIGVKYQTTPTVFIAAVVSVTLCVTIVAYFAFFFRPVIAK